MALDLYCGPTLFKYFTGRSSEHAERLCREVLGQSRQVRSMKVDDIVRVFNRLGFECMEHKGLPALIGKPLISLSILEIIREERGAWVFVVFNQNRSRTNHVVTVSCNEYKDSFTGGKWRPLTEIRNARLVDMWVLSKTGKDNQPEPGHEGAD